MGAQLSTAAPTATVPIDAYVAELQDITYVADLGRARFLKTIKGLHRQGDVVVKVFIKPTASFDIRAFRTAVTRYQLELNGLPNAANYARIVETDRACYLVRQYFKHNLYDRISTRPFLEGVEKSWITFQLLRALQDAHKKSVFHGDIKSENVLLTSWKWTYLSDWAPYKPVALPETDSAHFLFYFNTSQRRSCYVAPERFTTGNEKAPTELTAAMDIYSVGCVIAELFLEGQTVFSLADLFKYKRHEYFPPLSGIEDEDVRHMIESMISLDPEDRKSAEDYLEQYKGSIFPAYFWDVYDLQKDFAHATGATSDAMAEQLWKSFPDVLKWLDISVTPAKAVPGSVIPAVVSISDLTWVPQKGQPARDGVLVVLSLACSILRSTSNLSWRVRMCDVLLGLSEHVSDATRLDRVLPYLVSLLKDPNDAVQIASIRSMTHLLSITGTLTSLNENLFAEYLFPRLRAAVFNASPRVKAIYAACLPTLAELSLTMPVETASSDATTAMNSTITASANPSMSHIESHLRALLTEKTSTVRRALLHSIAPLCIFLGRQRTNDIVLSYTITFLNDKDPAVRSDFFEFVATVGPLIGPAGMEQYVIPLMVQSLMDPREEIVCTVLFALASLAELSLIRTKLLLNLLQACVKFLIHPNPYIRGEVSILFAASARCMAPAQKFTLLGPIISPVMASEVTDYASHRSYVAAVKPPMALAVYTLALSWASHRGDSAFWKPATTPANSKALGAAAVSFSEEDKRWLERLRDVGFNNEDLWQLILYREYFRHVAAVTKDTSKIEPTLTIDAPLTSWSGGHVLPGVRSYLLAHNKDYVVFNEDANGLAAPTDLTAPSSLRYAGSSVELVPAMPLKPAGTLVASIKAHRGAITALAVCDDHSMFVTGAEDGLIKLWDTRSIEKGTSRPSQTHDFPAAVRSACFLDGRTAFVTGLANGALHFLDSKTERSGPSLSHDPISILQSHILGSGYATELKSIGGLLYILTSESVVVILDLNTMEETHLQTPVEHGTPTSWVFDLDKNWLAIGTSHGIIDIWDLRFELLINTWGIGQLRPINSLALHPRVPSQWILVGGGFDRQLISAWDIQESECRELLVPMSESPEEDSVLPSLASIHSLADRFATWSLKDSFGHSRGTTALFTAGGVDEDYHYVVSGGSDRTIRYWDLQSPQNCMIVSGQKFNHGRTTYTARIGSHVNYTFENAGPVKKAERMSRTSVILNEESDIGLHHRGLIIRVAVVNVARHMIVSVDEVGYVKAFI